jgi:putative aminopeptidase FrvX
MKHPVPPPGPDPDYALLRTLCGIHAPSGNESAMTEFLLSYIRRHQPEWLVQPVVYSGEDFQHCIVLVFGKPRTAIFAHIDNIGYTVRYHRGLVAIGAPQARTGTHLVSTDAGEPETCTLDKSDGGLRYRSRHELPAGTTLSFAPSWKETESYVQCCYMDNRLGVLNALQLCATLRDGVVAFTCWEEHGGGSVSFVTRFLYEQFRIRQALISDITWATEGVKPGKGVAISLRDSGIPRKVYVDRILDLARRSGIAFQQEVEGSGGSDGTELQRQPYPIDWCFIGAPEEHVHSPEEKVHKRDIGSMFRLYAFLMENM